MVNWMQKFFQYLDRFYVEMHSIASLNDQGYKIFKEIVFNPLCDKLTTAICNEVKKQRLGQEVMETTDEQLRNIVKIYLKLSTGKLANDGFLPRINLDKALVEETRLFYEGKSNEVIVQTNLIDYLRETDKFYTQEKNRVTHIINWEIGEEILKTFRQEMLVKPQPQLLSKGNGFKDFIQDKRYDEIALLYQLYKQEQEHLKPIGEQFKTFISDQGKNLLKQVDLYNKDGKPMDIKEIIFTSQIVVKLLEMLQEYTNIVQNCFESNSSFEIQRA